MSNKPEDGWIELAEGLAAQVEEEKGTTNPSNVPSSNTPQKGWLEMFASHYDSRIKSIFDEDK